MQLKKENSLVFGIWLNFKRNFKKVQTLVLENKQLKSRITIQYVV